jgi:hypothetical protein
MLSRSLAGLACVLVVGGLVLADDTRGTISKIGDGTITIRTFGGFGKGKTKSEEKTYKFSKSVKITRNMGKDKDAVKLTLPELKTAVKVTNVFVTVTHEGEDASAITTGGGFGGGRRGKDKKKDE